MGTKHRNKAWKIHERNTARQFGSERTLIGEGRGKKQSEDFKTHSDSLHDVIYIESKYRVKHPIYNTTYRQLEAETESMYPNSCRKWPSEQRLGKNPVIPVVEVRLTGKRGTLICVKSYDLHLLAEDMSNANVKDVVYAVAAVFTLYADTNDKAVIENKIPCLSLKQHNQRGSLLVFNPSHLKIIQAWNKHQKKL